MPSKDSQWRFVVSPPWGRDPVRFGLSVTAFRILAAGALLVLALTITGIAIFSRLLKEAGKTKELATEVRRLREDNEKIVALAGEIDEIRASEQKVRQLLGISITETTGSADGSIDSPAPGSAVMKAPTQDEMFPRLWPIRGELSRAFTPGPERRHEGVDIAGRTGTPVVAAGGGTVAFAGPDSIFGNVVRIDHGNGYTTLYGHNSRLAVTAGQLVTRGQIIAYVGNTGVSSAPHLHFEVRRDGRSIDPFAFIGPLGSQGTRSK